MLQQTQAERVVGHYTRFLQVYPTPAELAAAAPAEVLSVWSGLGYNRRALRLREAARVIASTGWPTTQATLGELPGVGRYTAAAVACFAFGAQIATPDTNMRRVLGRWYGRTLHGNSLDEAAAAELPPGRAADWNQAVMDLGATCCKPLKPACSRCPVQAWCAGPETYAPPPPQPRFEGSARQARGAVVRTLVVMGSLTIEELAPASGMDHLRVAAAVEKLEREGLVKVSGTLVGLPS